MDWKWLKWLIWVCLFTLGLVGSWNLLEKTCTSSLAATNSSTMVAGGGYENDPNCEDCAAFLESYKKYIRATDFKSESQDDKAYSSLDESEELLLDIRKRKPEFGRDVISVRLEEIARLRESWEINNSRSGVETNTIEINEVRTERVPAESVASDIDSSIRSSSHTINSTKTITEIGVVESGVTTVEKSIIKKERISSDVEVNALEDSSIETEVEVDTESNIQIDTDSPSDKGSVDLLPQTGSFTRVGNLVVSNPSHSTSSITTIKQTTSNLFANDSGSTEQQMLWLRAHNARKAAEVFEVQTRFDEARTKYRESINWYDQLAEKFPNYETEHVQEYQQTINQKLR